MVCGEDKEELVLFLVILARWLPLEPRVAVRRGWVVVLHLAIASKLSFLP